MQLYNCQLVRSARKANCLFVWPWQRREDKNENPVASCLVAIGTTKEMNETSYY